MVRPPRLFAYATLSFVVGCRSVGPIGAPIDVTGAPSAAEASNRFGFDLYAQLRAQDENLIVSPISVSIALAMTAAGARGKTLEEMSRVLHVHSLGDAHAAFAGLLASLPLDQDREEGNTLAVVMPGVRYAIPARLSVADRVWARKGFTYREEFVSLLRDRYRAPLGEEDFLGAPETARAHINAWVGEQTRGRIPDLLPEGSIDDHTSLVLTNAVYFKAPWSLPFPQGVTGEEDFVTPRRTVRASMMRQTTEFAYTRVDDVQLVELPYLGQISMVVILPDDADGLGGVEDRIGANYNRWVGALTMRRVDLWLPKWKVTQRFTLDHALQTLGMKLAYSRLADFSGMTDMELPDPGKFHVSTVLQKAFIETNEFGTEATAATAVVMMVPSMAIIGPPPPEPVVFHADHSFLYVIRERKTGAILFVGRVVDPTRSPS
jgi:serpin B